MAVGSAVPPTDMSSLDALLDVLGAALGATHKVTDQHWLPRSRQIGITGRSISPSLYIGLGVSGKFNHMAGVRAAGMVVLVNSDPSAPGFSFCDFGMVADWREVVPLFTTELRRHQGGSFGGGIQRRMTTDGTVLPVHDN